MTKALVLGAYGLIGAACAAALKTRGFEVVGMGRTQESAQRAHLDIDWVIEDISSITVETWRQHLNGIDVVINAAGALQTGSRDRLKSIHVGAVSRLCQALEGSQTKLVHISAAGVSENATTAFFRTKAQGDAIIQASALDWTILRPTLVFGANAFGGTTLLRGVAGFPGIGPKIFSGCPVQAIALSELADAVADCAEARMPSHRVYDVTERNARGFGEMVSLVRAWLGFSRRRLEVPVPLLLVRLLAFVADIMGWLGWRSPLRTTAVRTMEQGVTGDPTAWRQSGGRPFTPFPDVLKALPSTLQERQFARLYLFLPLVIALLSGFWVASGVIGLWQMDRAATLLTSRGVGQELAIAAVLAGSVADIGLGLAILVRRWAKRACLGMVGLALAYLVAGALVAPELWADPLGPMVKVIPSIGLALLAYAMLEER